MNTIIENLEHKMNIQALKYACGKFIFCPYSHKVLDYRNSILVTINKDKEAQTFAINGSFIDKMSELRDKLEAKGMTFEYFANIKKTKK